ASGCTRTSFPALNPRNAAFGRDDLDDADAEAAVDGDDLALGDQRAVGHDVEQLVRLAVELDDAALGKLHQLRELQRRAADLDRQADRDIGEQAEIPAPEGKIVGRGGLDDFLTFLHEPILLCSIFSILSAARPSCSPTVPRAIRRPATIRGTCLERLTGMMSPA